MIKLPEIKLICTHLVVFILGGLSVLPFAYLGHTDKDTHPRPRNRTEMAERFQSFLADKLHLTPDQVSKLQPILADTGTQMDAIRKTMRTQAEEVLSASNAKISSILTPDQQTSFTKIEADQKSHSHF